jgi:hypothetical protein
MARPQPAPALRRTRPDSHAFEQVATPAPAAEVPADSPVESRNAATTANRNDADAASRNAATKAEALVKFSIRVAPDKHRHIKATAAMQGMSIQDLAVTALSEYLERLGRPLP